MAKKDAETGRSVVTFDDVGKHVATIGGRNYKMAQQVTRSVLQQKDDVPVHVKIEAPIRRALERAGRKPKDPNSAPPPAVVDVINLETGELQVLVCGAMLESALTEKYEPAPVDRDGVIVGVPGYVGRSFALVSRLVNMPGSTKRMRDYQIIEIEAE